METAKDWQPEPFGSYGDMEELQKQLLRFLKHIQRFSKNAGANICSNAALYRKVLSAYFVMKRCKNNRVENIVEEEHDDLTGKRKPLTKTEQGNLASCFIMLDHDRKQTVLDTVQEVFSLSVNTGSESFDVMTLAPDGQHTFYGAVLGEYNKQVEHRVRESARKRQREEEEDEHSRLREKRNFAKATQKHRTHRIDRYICRLEEKRHRPLAQDEKKDILSDLDALDEEKINILSEFLKDLECSTSDVRHFLRLPGPFSGHFMLDELNDTVDFPPAKQWGIYDAIKVLQGQQISELCYARMEKALNDAGSTFMEDALYENAILEERATRVDPEQE
eukprot:GEMP01043557.1.p1 GENE.GEMP01043557.1~~GEMP01043557.1.p1  ORF type:complete len:334 (+),score=70.67 GEMP01043557.1:144-1145(+)